MAFNERISRNTWQQLVDSFFFLLAMTMVIVGGETRARHELQAGRRTSSFSMRTNTQVFHLDVF